jgi:predicted O-methyltransferase YrrM
VYTALQLAPKYLGYYLHASNSKGHGMHSPFVFDFILNVLNNDNKYMAPAGIEQLRAALRQSNRSLQHEELGAGSHNGSEKTIGSIAKSALKPRKYAEVLFRLVRHYQPQTVVELGTSLGITTAYMSSAQQRGSIYTIEGSKAVAAEARRNLDQLGQDRVQTITGNFDEQLPALLKTLESVDLAFIDGNHRYQPTINYFKQFLEKVRDHSILIFDDIHWSAEMERAWEEIKAHPSVQYSIDIFFLGFVFFRKDFKVKQHFTIRF